jgi:hypothetical protein
MCRITVEVPIGRILQGTVVGGRGKSGKKGKEEKGEGKTQKHHRIVDFSLFV